MVLLPWFMTLLGALVKMNGALVMAVLHCEGIDAMGTLPFRTGSPTCIATSFEEVLQAVNCPGLSTCMLL